MAELQYSKQATKYLRKMPKAQARKIHSALLQIAAGIDEKSDIKWLSNLKVYRMRQGNYRAQYEFLDNRRRMVVGKIGIRGDFYK
jgi:mRNA-degrading endonuclease RelE of RelBE toxin-antitoxin system